MRIFYTAIFTVIVFSAGAQTTNTFPASGNVGIGILSPSEILTIRDPNIDHNSASGLVKFRFDSGAGGGGIGFEKESYNTGGLRFYTQYGYGTTVEKMRITSNGNVGIGTTSPGARLSFPSVVESDLPDGITWHSPDPLSWGIYKTAGSWTGPNYTQLKLIWGTGLVIDPGISHPKCYVDIQGGGLRVTSGNVGIGTTDTQGFKLAVNGNIRAHEIKVETANWPDYVFAKDYPLPTLQETEKHIKDKGHLPGIPSAAEVKANGVDLGEMNAKLLQKIEELTLHLIELKKEIKDLQLEKNRR